MKNAKKAVCFVISSIVSTGCQNATMQERIEAFRQINAELARSGVAGVATFHWGGAPGVGMRQGFYFDTEADLTITVQYNAAVSKE